MHRLAIVSAVVLLLICAAVSSADAIGIEMFGLLRSAALAVATDEGPATSSVRLFADRHLPIRLRAVDEGAFVAAHTGQVTLVRDGQVVRRSSVGLGGTVQVAGLDAGPCSVFINGSDGFAAFAAWVSPSASYEGGPGGIIDIGLVPHGDMPTVRAIIDTHYSSSVGTQQPVEVDNVVTQLDTSDDRDLIHGYGFELQADGTVRGRIARTAPPGERRVPLMGMNVYYIREGEVVAEAVTDAEGLFTVNGLHSGIHTFVAAGPGGFLAVAVDVQPGSPLTPVSFDESPVTATAQANPIPPTDIAFLLESMDDSEDTDENGPGTEPDPAGEEGGGSNSGSGGGSSNSGGGGSAAGDDGLGTLLGLGALGLGVWAISEANDDGRVSNGSP